MSPFALFAWLPPSSPPPLLGLAPPPPSILHLSLLYTALPPSLRRPSSLPPPVRPCAGSAPVFQFLTHRLTHAVCVRARVCVCVWTCGTKRECHRVRVCGGLAAATENRRRREYTYGGGSGWVEKPNDKRGGRGRRRMKQAHVRSPPPPPFHLQACLSLLFCFCASSVLPLSRCLSSGSRLLDLRSVCEPDLCRGARAGGAWEVVAGVRICVTCPPPPAP